MELELMYPKVIIYSLVISAVLLLAWRKKKKYRKGVLVANTSYLKKSAYYRTLLLKYHIYNILIKACCILLIFACAYLSARLYHEDKFEEKHDNRDIVLCMDVSGSVYNLDADISKSLQSVVSSLKDERFGVTVFDNSAISLVPLTSDYLYAEAYLKNIEKVFSNHRNLYSIMPGSTSSIYSGSYKYYSTAGYIDSDQGVTSTAILIRKGTTQLKGSSLIGDGIASCALSFKKDEERTKILILTTDNQVMGNQIMTVKEAAEYCRDNGIKIYAIGTKNIQDINKKGLEEAASITGGKYFDFERLTTDQIVNEINTLNKTSIVTKTYVMSKDFPEVVFVYLLIITAVLFVLDWRVRI